MENVMFKKDSRKTLEEQPSSVDSQNKTNEEDTFDTLQRLEIDETRLMEQKDNLTTLLYKLENKAKEELEKRKRRIQKLSSEVTDLKKKCEKYTTWINTGLPD